jgi:hypothetical protein
MLYLLTLLILITLGAGVLRAWPTLPGIDRLYIVAVLGYLALALLLPTARWLAGWLPPAAGGWFYVGVSVALALFGLARVLRPEPAPGGHRSLLLWAAVVAAIPALIIGLFSLVWR